MAGRRTAFTRVFLLLIWAGLTHHARLDAGRQDAYWCPMHPGVRSPAAGKCPLCAMELVPIRPPAIGEYQMDVRVTPGAGGHGLRGLRFLLRDPANGRPVSDLLTVHEKPLHLFLISRDLTYFAHAHPVAEGNGRFALKHDLPPGEYVVVADFLPANGTAQMVHRAIVAPGGRPALSPVAVAPPLPDIPDAAARASGTPSSGTAEKTIDGVRIRLEAADLVGGQMGQLRFRLTNAVDHAPVIDLEPYLGATGHMLLTNTSLTDAVHGHPEEVGTSTSVITFKPFMPSAGVAKVWLQFQRKGRVTTAPFVIEIQEP